SSDVCSSDLPGLFRNHYSFMYFVVYKEAVYLEYRAQLEKKIQKAEGCRIMASDHSQQAVMISEENAKNAGASDLIEFETLDFREIQVPDAAEGMIFFNPEYGERLGETEELAVTYREIGDFMKKNAAGYNGFIFTGNPELAKKVGLKAKKRMEFYNGTIDCRLLQYDLYRGSKQPK